MSEVSLKSLIATPFHEVHRDIVEENHSKYWLKGGRGSTKSSFVAIEVVLGIVKDSEANGIIFRKVADTIRTSVHANIAWAIDELQLSMFFDITYSPAEFTYRPTGQKILCKGLDKAKKLKSIKLPRGYFKYIWFEELDEFTNMEEIRNVEQSVKRGGEKFVEFLTYNPPNDKNSWVNTECNLDDDSRLIHHSTYLDVPKEWLGDIFIEDAERLKRNNYEAYCHEYLGDVIGRAEQIVFHDHWEVKEFETPPLHEIWQGHIFYGADWGFSQDPTAIVRLFIKGDDLYIEYEAGGVGIEIDHTPALFDKIPEVRKWHIKADCARPETISYMARHGFNISGAEKWKESDIEGVQYLKSFKRIYIHPRCKETIEEFKRYSYKIDSKTSEILPVLEDKYNHYIDAIRYALVTYIKTGVSILDVI